MMKLKPLCLFLPLFMISSCYSPNNSSSNASSKEDVSSGESISSIEESTATSNSEATSTSSEKVSSEPLSDDFSIANLPFIYYGNPAEPLIITDTDRADEIEYEYDDEYIDITDNKVRVIKDLSVTSGYEFKQKKEISVKATLGSRKHYFTVSIKKAVDRENKMAGYVAQQTSRGVTKNTHTLVMGDSFFDYYYDRGWSQIYNDIGGNIFNSGVAASTFEEWFYYAPKLIYNIAPKYIAMHLGTNDFWDLNSTVEYNFSKFIDFVERIHYHCPNTKILYFSIENRGNNMTGKSASETIAALNEYNTLVKNYCSTRSYLTYYDSFTHFTNSDGSCKMSLFYDDYVHPLPSEHPFYIEAMISSGIDNITYIGGTTPSSFSRTSSQSVSVEPVAIRRNNVTLTSNFVVSGTVNYSYSSNSNAHFEFGIGSHGPNRLLLWNHNNSANTLYAAAIYNSDYSKISNTDGISGTSNSFTFKLLVSSKSAYLFVNNKLKALLYNYIQSNEITLSSELMNVNATNISINVMNDGTSIYENLLATVSSYETDTSTTIEGRVIN